MDGITILRPNYFKLFILIKKNNTGYFMDYNSFLEPTLLKLRLINAIMFIGNVKNLFYDKSDKKYVMTGSCGYQPGGCPKSKLIDLLRLF